MVSLLLGTTADEVVAAPAESLLDLLDRTIDNDAVMAIVRSILAPGVTILLILLIAFVASRLARRAISRIVARMKGDGDEADERDERDESSPLSGLRARLRDPDEVEDLRRVQRADALGALASSIVTVVIWSITVIMVLGQIGIELAPLIAGAGIVGVAIGFGAQDLVKDFLSGIFMLIEDQYGVGDIIDAGEAIGVVEGITLRSTRIRDVEGTLWHVPNGEIRRVGNKSQGWARALLDVNVAYGTDVDAAGALIERVAVDMAHEEEYTELFLDEPELWGVEMLGADGIDIRLVIKVLPGKQWAIMRELRRRIKRALDDAGVEIPFPQRTVWLRTEQPVAFGGADAPSFGETAGHELDPEHAAAEAKRGEPAKLTGEFDEVQEDVTDEQPDRDVGAVGDRHG